MNPALTHLAALRLQAGLRKRWQQLRTPRGAAYLILSIVVLGTLLLSRSDLVASSLATMGMEDPGSLRQRTATWLPFSLLVMCIYAAATATGPAFFFSAAERNFLVTAPVSRRDILLYKFSLFALGTLLSACVIGLLVPADGFATAIVVGTFATFTFAQLFNVCTNLAVAGNKALSARRAASQRGWRLLPLLALAAYGVYLYLQEQSLTQLIATDPVLNVLVLPFVPFARILTAQTLLPVFGWGALALTINAALLCIALWLDARTQHSNDPPASAAEKQKSKRIKAMPLAGRLLAINPIAGAQALTAMRSGGRRLMLLLVMMAFLGPALVAPSETFSLWTRIGLLFMIAAYVLPRSLVYDFRRELGTVAHTKSLPLPRWQICLGQLLVPTVMATVCIWVLLLSAMPWLSDSQRTLTGQLALYAPLASGLLFAADNLLFLLFPAAHVPAGRVDFDFMGRAMIELFAKTLLLLAAAGLALWIGIWTVRALGFSTLGLVATSWCIMAIVLALMLILLSWALKRFELR